MEIRPLKTDAEIQKYVTENFGSYENYHKNRLADPPTMPSVAVAKSAAEITCDYYTSVAKARGLSLEQFFKLYPAEYKNYSELATARNY